MKKSLFLLPFLLLVLPLVVAYPVTIRLNSNVGVFDTAVYKCTGSTCAGYSYYASSHGNPNTYVITGSGDQYFAEYDYKACYVSHAYITDTNSDTGSGPWDYDVNFNKQSGCIAEINSASLSANTVLVNTPVTLTANVQSAFDFHPDGPQSAPEVLRVPYYSSKTDVNFYVNGVLKGNKQISIYWNRNQNVAFSFTPTSPGTYELKIETELDNDCQCSSDIPQYKIFYLRVNECNPGQTESKQCGPTTDVGECQFGRQERVCTSSGVWGSWGGCIGAVYPKTEICNGKDDDCDGQTDESGNALCTDGKYCNGQEFCAGLQGCRPGTAIDCSGLNDQCNKGVCDESIDSCKKQPKPDGTTCNDNLFCTVNDKCSAGVCGGTKNVCSDSVSCTVDSCNEQTNACQHAPNNALCNDGLFCNGVEKCSLTLGCQAGVGVDCSSHNLPVVAECNYVPDNNGFTWDSAAGFTSACNEAADKCSVGSYSFTHVCNVLKCGAQCDAAHQCAATDCDYLDKCVGNDYYDYTDVSNSCLAGCTCTNNQCGAPKITYNDARCTQCQDDDDCNGLDKDYCLGDLIKHNEGRCVNYKCVVETTTKKDCNSLNADYCDGTQIKHKDYTCQAATCVIDSITVVQDCDDKLFCDGQEGCSNAACTAGTPVDCSGLNDQCNLGVCNEAADSCKKQPKVNGTVCNDGLFCTVNDKCSAGVCGGTKNVCSDSVSCTVDSCNEQTNACQHAPNNALCNDGLFCNGVEKCSLTLGCQAGVGVDCSSHNLPVVAECNYVPDNNGLTWDSAAGFTSACNEAADKCSVGSYSFTHVCNVLKCGAQCDASHPCAATDCDYLDKCVGNNFYDYSDVLNTCLSGCTCTNNQCGAPKITYNDVRCTQCQDDDDCNGLDKDYCLGDLIKHDEGRCVNYKCVVETTTKKDCNSLNADYCEGTQIKHKEYACQAATCILDSITVVQECDNKLYCDGQEGCSNAKCISGKPVDCSAYNLPTVGECNHVPDNNGFTWDSAAGFTSACNEAADKCSVGSYSFTHVCNVLKCGAQCDAAHQCAATDCDYLDKCVGNDYYDYTDVSNSCLAGCTCTNNQCGAPKITYNDVRCTQCQDDDDCNGLDKDYCLGDLIKHDEGRCVNYKCVVETSTVKNCNNGLYCDGKETCNNAACIPGTVVDCSGLNDQCNVGFCNEATDSCKKQPKADGTTCNDGLFCTVDDKCSSGSCGGTTRLTFTAGTVSDTLSEGETKTYTLDGKDYEVTLDYVGTTNCKFTVNKEATITLAETDTYKLTDGIELGVIDIIAQQFAGGLRKVEFSLGAKHNISCADSIGCTMDYCNEQTDSCQHIPNNDLCNDGLYCNGVETCSLTLGCLPGSAVDCSAYNLPTIAKCDNNPDNNPFTWDYASGFVSQCSEVSDSCSQGKYAFAHKCDVVKCGAQCDASHPCAATDCDYLDRCVGTTFYDYQDIPNACLVGCTCTNNVCGAPTLYPNDPRCRECTPGQTKQCGISNVGECRFGNQTCGINGTWGKCTGAINPKPEVCDGRDNDCDGVIDESLPIACSGDGNCPNDGLYFGQYRNYYCYTPGTCFSECRYDIYDCIPGEIRGCGFSDVGICAMGYQYCYGLLGWSKCFGAVYPAEKEICGNNIDDNCNAKVDEGCYEEEIYPRGIISINKLMVYNDCVRPGTDFDVMVAFQNIASYDLKGIRVMGIIDELNQIVKLGPMSLKHGDEKTQMLYFGIPLSAQEGDYTLTVTVSNDDFKRLKHRTFRVSSKCPFY